MSGMVGEGEANVRKGDVSDRFCVRYRTCCFYSLISSGLMEKKRKMFQAQSLWIGLRCTSPVFMLAFQAPILQPFLPPG